VQLKTLQGFILKNATNEARFKKKISTLENPKFFRERGVSARVVVTIK
jgi:hypothetical protein